MKLTASLKTFLFAAALLIGYLPIWAQPMVSNENEDEVYKVDQSASQAYRTGQVIVKFKDSSPVNMKKVNGKFKTSSVNTVDNVLNDIGILEIEPLMPLTGDIKNRAPRKAKALSGRMVTEPNLSKLYCLKFDSSVVQNVEDVVERLEAMDEVEFAEPNYLVFIQSVEDATAYESEPMYSQQWGLNAINMPQLWEMPKNDDTRPIIAILDTGVDITHPDLADNIWTNTREAEGANYEDDDNNGYVDDVHGWDFIAGTAIIGNGMDRNGHGTHCAGIAAAVGNNGIGITGANPDALILPIKVFGDDGTGDVATICRGIDYANACGAHVLSMSFGGSSSTAEYQALCKTLTNYAVLVGAAGNSGIDINILNSMVPSPSFPGAYDIVLGVMASNSNGQLAGFSNYDPDGPFFSKYSVGKAFSSDVTWDDEKMWNYDLMAPGVNIMSTYLNGSYKALNGTSMATPMVAGAISRILQVKGYDYARDYGLIGDMAMAKNGGITDLAVFNAYQAASFDETNRQVALALTALDIDDSEGDGDGRFDAGETISIWPTIRSLWGHAENIKIHIEPYDVNVPTDALEMLDNNVDFGWSLNTRGSFKSQNPIRVKVNENANDGLHLPYKIIITSDNLLAGVEQEHVFEVENGVELSGVLNEDMVLYPNKHYIVTKSIAVPQGITLTILPGTRLEFNEGCFLQSEGKLVANGTPDRPIVFTSREGQGAWGGIRSHSSYPSSGPYPSYYGLLSIYTNEDKTLFTLAKTDVTPIELSGLTVTRYVPNDWSGTRKEFYLKDYFSDFRKDLRGYQDLIFMNDKKELLSDPDFIAAPMQQLMQDWNAYPDTISDDYPKRFNFVLSFPNNSNGLHLFPVPSNPCDTISYAVIENFNTPATNIYFKDCVIKTENPANGNNSIFGLANSILEGERCTFFLKNRSINYVYKPAYTLQYSNFVDCTYNNGNGFTYAQLKLSNLINTGSSCFVGRSNGLTVDHADYPSWLGSGKEDIIRPYIYDSRNPNVDCFTTVDLSNMPTRPFSEAHGIIWKVVVDGYDAQDEFDLLPPLGVGRHEFKVYFNRPVMDQTSTPKISMGLREPYTQTMIAEDGTWSVDDGAAVYTAYLTITGKTNADGLNRICVTGAKDDEFFDVPDEKYRFNVLVQAAGSMATGFAAEAGLGKVDLTWNNESNDFDDAMGFNVYRFQLNAENDTINRCRLNETIIDLDTDEFTDYEVTPGSTYYYYYKVLSTDLKEYDISNVVAATPLTSTLGDANGSGDVDVADVITTVNYAAGMEPRPFIFEAADVNTDTEIDILDVIGIIRLITNPNAVNTTSTEEVAVYSVKDGVVYVDSPVALAGIQVMLNAERNTDITTDTSLKGFEQVSAWTGDNNYLFLAYNMAGRTLDAGRTALLHIGEASVAELRLSDAAGHNVLAVPATVTVIDDVNIALPQSVVAKGIYDLTGRKVADDAEELGRLAPGIYSVDGIKVVKK